MSAQRITKIEYTPCSDTHYACSCIAEELREAREDNARLYRLVRELRSVLDGMTPEPILRGAEAVQVERMRMIAHDS